MTVSHVKSQENMTKTVSCTFMLNLTTMCSYFFSTELCILRLKHILTEIKEEFRKKVNEHLLLIDCTIQKRVR